MGLILSILMLGLMASLSPATIVVFIVVLGTARPRANAAGFLLGWATSLTVVFTLSYLVGSSRSVQHGGGRTGVMVFQVLVGCALLVVSARQWRRRGVVSRAVPTAGSQKMLGRLRDLRPGGALLLGVLKQPWAITTAAAVFVVHHHTQALVTLIAFACFTVASTASVGLMYVYYARRPVEAEAYLNRLRSRAIASGPVVFAVAALLLGTLLVLDGLLGLAG
ncbi:MULTISPECIES: GAP family protein [Aeromicrobium]|uniref:GAP family protein n=1 Tax=Aeromicrobium phoceense TaxID=2754045 RepID=A0A838X910_9ACTN|nr:MULTISPECIES: GAP family protein [Aeromicrobium]MBA4607065.1 GAP family protein [Aeromicrobium phoceense]